MSNPFVINTVKKIETWTRFLPLLLIAFLVSGSAVASEFEYVESDGEVTITRYHGTEQEVTIPSSIDEFPVTEIQSAFAFNADLSAVTIPDTVQRIRGDAFLDCVSLEQVNLPEGLILLDQHAFQNCRALKEITIPNSLGNVVAVFTECSSLTNIVVAEDHPTLSSTGNAVFNEAGTLLMRVNAGKSKYRVPDGVTEIAYLAVDDPIMDSIVLPDSVSLISDLALTSEAVSLKNVYMLGEPPLVVGSWNPNNKDLIVSQKLVIHYLPDALVWGTEFGGQPTAVWKPLLVVGALETNHVKFHVDWAKQYTVQVEAANDLTDPVWSLVDTVNLSDGIGQFTTLRNKPAGYYRLKWE